MATSQKPCLITIQPEYYSLYKHNYEEVKKKLYNVLLLQPREIYYHEVDYDYLVMFHLIWNVNNEYWQSKGYAIPCNENYDIALQLLRAGIYQALYEAPYMGFPTHDLFY